MGNLDRNSQGLGRRPALLLVDMIVGFTDPASALGCETDSVVAANRELLAVFRAKHLPVAYTTVVYRDDNEARLFRDRLPALEALKPGSRWVEIDPRLAPRPGEPVLEKQWASGFFKTGLDEFLRGESVDSLVVTGLTTSGCVRATAVDGLQHDYRVVVPREAVGDRNEEAHRANLFDLDAKYADVLDLAQILPMLEDL
ncbi:MAG: isochorismatase family protein [Lysobacterales bacterium]